VRIKHKKLKLNQILIKFIYTINDCDAIATIIVTTI